MARHSTVRPSASITRIGGAGIAALACATLAACSGSSSGGGSPTPADTTAQTTVTTTTTPPVGTSPATTSGTTTQDTGSGNGGSGNGGSDDSDNGDSGGGNGASSNGYCAESQLRASIEKTAIPGNGKNGEHAVIVDFLNKSSSSCVLYGYPGAAIEDSSNKQVQQAKRTIRGRLLGFPPGQNTLPKVTLKPGAIATAGLEGTDQQEQGTAQAGCDAPDYPRILVTPPNTRTPVPFSIGWPRCYSFTVHPVNIKK